jgi:hypothetical protein
MNAHHPDPDHRGLRLFALASVIIGVVALAGAAFVLSYEGVHEIVLAAGVPAQLARLYPAIFDAVLVVACAAALTLRGARWWTRFYVWASIILLIGIVGAGDAVHAMGIKLPHRPAAATVAAIPWALLMLGFSLWLSMLRNARTDRFTAAGSPTAYRRSTALLGDPPGRPGEEGDDFPGRPPASAEAAMPGRRGPAGAPQRDPRAGGPQAGTAEAEPSADTGGVDLAMDAEPGLDDPTSDEAHLTDERSAPDRMPAGEDEDARPYAADSADAEDGADADDPPGGPAPHFDRVRSTPTPPGE